MPCSRRGFIGKFKAERRLDGEVTACLLDSSELAQHEGNCNAEGGDGGVSWAISRKKSMISFWRPSFAAGLPVWSCRRGMRLQHHQHAQLQQSIVGNLSLVSAAGQGDSTTCVSATSNHGLRQTDLLCEIVHLGYGQVAPTMSHCPWPTPTRRRRVRIRRTGSASRSASAAARSLHGIS